MMGLPALAPLTHGNVEIAPIRLRDWKDLSAVLDRNRSWLRPWQTTDPLGRAPADARTLVRSLVQATNAGEIIAYAVRVGGEFAGQVTISSIEYGALSTAQLGYWISERFAGRDVIPIATALATDFAFGSYRLHRMEICIRTENHASLRVVEKLGFRFEGHPHRRRLARPPLLRARERRGPLGCPGPVRDRHRPPARRRRARLLPLSRGLAGVTFRHARAPRRTGVARS